MSPYDPANVPPERSLRQRMDALGEANRIRTIRADAKRELKSGRLQWTDLLDVEEFATMPLYTVLVTLPKLGRVKANKVLQIARISPSKKLGGLTTRQRMDLARVLPRVAPSLRYRYINHDQRAGIDRAA